MPVALPQGTILGPDGSVAHKPAQVLGPEDAALFISYAQYLRAQKLSRKLWCHDCRTYGEIETTDDPVTDQILEMLWTCTCRMLLAKLPV